MRVTLGVSKTSRVLIGAIICVLALMFFVSRTAHAHMFTKDDCISLANDAVTFAERNRDSPESTEHDAVVLAMILSMKMGSENSYVKDAQDKKRVMDMFNEVTGSDWTPGQAYDHEYEQCMKKTAPELPKGEKSSGTQVES